MRQDYEASKGVVATPRSGRGDKGARRHYSCQLSLLIQGIRYVFSHLYKMIVACACDCMCEFRGRNSLKWGRM